MPSPQSPFEKIKKLKAGCYMFVRRGDISIRQYWNVSLEPSERPGNTNLAEEMDEVEATVREAVGMELMSDVPLGCFLSGGVDSSAIATLAQQYQGTPLHTYCYKFAESSHDESEDARAVADHIKSIHHEIFISEEDILNSLDSLVDSLDEPFADSTFLTLSSSEYEFGRRDGRG